VSEVRMHGAISAVCRNAVLLHCGQTVFIIDSASSESFSIFLICARMPKVNDAVILYRSAPFCTTRHIGRYWATV